MAPTPKARSMLDHRKAAILNAVVAEYIETAQPVGSAHITGNPGVEVSSATVRSEMAALERDGYLAQPHTSAGRIPTDKGYRFFVDHLGRPGTLGRTSATRCASSSPTSTVRSRTCSVARAASWPGSPTTPRSSSVPATSRPRSARSSSSGSRPAWPCWSSCCRTGPWRSAPSTCPPTPPTTLLAEAAAHLNALHCGAGPWRPRRRPRVA